MDTKINSFTEVVNNLVNQTNIALESLVKLNQSLTTQDDTVTLSVEVIDPVTGEVSIATYTIPSYNKVINKVNAISNTVDTFVKGEGVVLLNDGTYRQVSTIPVAKSPDRITNISAPTKFTTRSNWFFESMMFPQLIVSFNLKNKIDDRSDRVVVRRIIFDNFDEEETQWFLDNVVGVDRTYFETITLLNNNSKEYWEDEEVQELPLLTKSYTGTFTITDIQTIDGKQWYYLDTMNYGIPSDSLVIKNHQLAIEDQLRYGNNSIVKIDDIQITEQRIHIIPLVGLGNPTINSSFEIYSIPFSTKILNIPVGYDECNIIFLKGVNDDFNIIGDDWSNSISFYSNYLTLGDGITTLETYYNSYVADFGRQLEGQAKENFIPAYYGITPNAPVFSTSNFQVKQINTQLNSALSTENIKSTQTQIESVKSNINSLKTTIASQKAELVSLTDAGQRATLQGKIDTNNSNLSKLTVEYRSLVSSLATIAFENSAVLVNPKYHIRGFFPIPEPKGTPPQYIVQFEISYRYLKLDNTGIELNSFSYIDPFTSQIVTGVFTDWTSVFSNIRPKEFDSVTNTYIWATENIGDGNINNINQVDIPITRGEQVELKIRSISEAGWPLNPLKSVWSSTVIIGFPPNLESSDQISNILTGALEEETTIRLDETLASAGIVTHLDDSIPNPNSGTGTYFKHQARALAFDLKAKDENGVIEETSTTDLQTQLESLSAYTYITVTKPTLSLSAYPQLTGTLQQFIQAIVNIDPSIYDEFQFIVV
jgi:hypothetical protein